MHFGFFLFLFLFSKILVREQLGRRKISQQKSRYLKKCIGILLRCAVLRKQSQKWFNEMRSYTLYSLNVLRNKQMHKIDKLISKFIIGIRQNTIANETFQKKRKKRKKKTSGKITIKEKSIDTTFDHLTLASKHKHARTH